MHCSSGTAAAMGLNRHSLIAKQQLPNSARGEQTPHTPVAPPRHQPSQQLQKSAGLPGAQRFNVLESTCGGFARGSSSFSRPIQCTNTELATCKHGCWHP